MSKLDRRPGETDEELHARRKRYDEELLRDMAVAGWGLMLLSAVGLTFTLIGLLKELP